MKKPLIIVATMVALAGCQNGTSSHQSSGAQSGSSSAQAQSRPSEQDPASASAAASAANAPKPNMPIGQTDGQAFPQPNGQADSQANARGDQFGDASSRKDSGPGWSTSSSAGSQSGDLGSASTPDIQVGGNAGDAADAGGSSVQTPDQKSDAQRGSVLTNEGAVKPSARNGASSTRELPSTSSESTHSSNEDAAERSTTRSLHVPDALDSAKDANVGSQSGALSGDAADAGTDRPEPAITDASTLGETDSDRNLTQQIRQAVVNDETLSLAAKSVQIQSSNGQIILKGQVDSEREKARIGSTAFRASGGKLVLNQLEVSGR